MDNGIKEEQLNSFNAAAINRALRYTTGVAQAFKKWSDQEVGVVILNACNKLLMGANY